MYCDILNIPISLTKMIPKLARKVFSIKMISNSKNNTLEPQSIAAVVVTYNRVDLLSECVVALSTQSQPLDCIYIIDNCSTDRTEDTVQQLIKSLKTKIKYIRLDTNTGGSGGFNRGVQEAIEDGHHWIWLMDDDVEPYPEGLKNLLKYQQYSKCIHGQRTSTDGTVYFWEAEFTPKLGLAIPYADISFKKGRSYCEVNVGCFEGMLIHRDIVKKIGYPDPRFFIAWDDTIYGYLASKYTPVLYVKELALKRKRSLNYIELGFRKLAKTSDLYRYYHIRNRSLVKQYLQNEPTFSPLLFNLTTATLLIKEVVRSIILDRNLSSFRPLYQGLRAGPSLRPYSKQNQNLSRTT